MALKAKVTAVNALPLGNLIAVDVDYFDDAAPDVILHHHAFEFAITLTVSQCRTQIENYGGKVRDAIATKVARAASFVGVVLDIP
jgi:hypothetical protein